MAAKRLLVSLDEKIFDEIAGFAKINNESLSKVAKDLVITSLELQEDKILAKLADERIVILGNGLVIRTLGNNV